MHIFDNSLLPKNLTSKFYKYLFKDNFSLGLNSHHSFILNEKLTGTSLYFDIIESNNHTSILNVKSTGLASVS